MRQNQKRDIWAVLSAIIAIIALLFGDNLFQQFTERSLFDNKKNIATPSSEAISLTVLDKKFHLTTDDGSLDRTESNAGAGHQPSIIYCQMDVKIGNLDGKSHIFTNFTSVISFGSNQVIQEVKNNRAEYLQKTPDAPFTCVGSNLTTKEPGIILAPIDFPTSIAPTTTQDIPIEYFYVPQQELLDCAQDPYRERIRNLDISSVDLPIAIGPNGISNFYVVTKFYLLPDKHEYEQVSSDGFAPITISSQVTDVNGQNLVLGTYNCFYFR